MKPLVLALSVVSFATVAAPALAEHHEAPKAEVVERDAGGKPTKVKIGDKVYDLCVSDKQDSCINPRDAGLDFGTRELNYWPGKPASEFDHPLPADKPATLPAEEPEPAASDS